MADHTLLLVSAHDLDFMLAAVKAAQIKGARALVDAACDDDVTTEVYTGLLTLQFELNAFRVKIEEAIPLVEPRMVSVAGMGGLRDA